MHGVVHEEVEDTSTYNESLVTPFWFSFSRVCTLELGGDVVRAFWFDEIRDWAVVGVIVWDGSVRSGAGSSGGSGGGGRWKWAGLD
jgi:hypothetical protein